MPRNPQIDRLIAIIEPVCKDVGCELVDVRLLMELGGWVLRVCIDRPLPEGADLSKVHEERVDLSECENVSRLLSAALDVDDPITQAYNLEVSSPGIERPLRTASHFRTFIGAEAKIQLSVPLVVANAPSGERRNFRGVLAGVHGAPPSELVMIDVDGHRYELPLDDVDSARLIPDWDDVMRGGSGVSRPKADGKKSKKSKPAKQPSESSGRGTSTTTTDSPEDGEADHASREPSPDVPSPDHRLTES